MYTDQVKKGAALLDKEVPDWRGRIDTFKLDIESWTQCVLGQVFGAYDEGLDQLTRTRVLAGIDTSAWQGRCDFAVEHGFNTREDQGSGALTDAWLDELAVTA